MVCLCRRVGGCMTLLMVFFFKQKTAYEMRMSDWSSDVCSSDLEDREPARGVADLGREIGEPPDLRGIERLVAEPFEEACDRRLVLAEIGRASCRERVCQYV